MMGQLIDRGLTISPAIDDEGDWNRRRTGRVEFTVTHIDRVRVLWMSAKPGQRRSQRGGIRFLLGQRVATGNMPEKPPNPEMIENGFGRMQGFVGADSERMPAIRQDTQCFLDIRK